MDGVRRASAHAIVFQAHRGAPELNCCAVNGPRGIGMLSEWAAMSADDGVSVNYYGQYTVQLPPARDNMLTLTQTTHYPRDGRVTIAFALTKPHTFTVRLRVPAWSRTTTVALNERDLTDVSTGTYLALTRQWKSGDTIRLTFDLALHLWVGEDEQANRVSIYRGPVLLAYDQRFNAMDPEDIPSLDAHDLSHVTTTCNADPAPCLLLRFHTVDGRDLVLCDFATAGATGMHYRTWLPLCNGEELPPELQSPFGKGRHGTQGG